MKKTMPKGFYAITDDKHSNGKDNITLVKEMLDAGVKILQYREKRKQKIEKFKECEVIRKLVEEYKCFFIINDDIDIALDLNSDGLHIGQMDLSIEKAREIVGSDMVIGLSTSKPEQALLAQQKGADYIGVGPIYQTDTKDDAENPTGLEYLNFCVRNIKIPKVAIGGIKLLNLAQICKYKPDNICLISEVTMAQDVKAVIAIINEIINDCN